MLICISNVVGLVVDNVKVFENKVVKVVDLFNENVIVVRLIL